MIENLTVTTREQKANRMGLETASTLHGLLAARANLLEDRQAYTFEGNDGPVTLTFRQLDDRARAIACQLSQTVKVGDRVLLLFPAGLDFVAAFFGCLYAGVRAVPATYPKPRRPVPRLTSIANDSGAVAALTDSQTLTTLDASIKASNLPQMKWLCVDDAAVHLGERFDPPAVTGDDVAFLQYTSGSTSDPKGVMVTHGNLLHNLEMIRQGFGFEPASAAGEMQTGVFWLPAYHDMGLIGGILESMHVGGYSVLMSPADFLQRPIGWLEKMSQYQATVSGAPNFAFELCVDRSTEEQRRELDLSNWKVAFCGAEPIRPETLEHFAKAFAVSGFSDGAFYPCYGLAEGTLLAAGGDGPSKLRTANVDRAELEQHQVKLVDGCQTTGAQRLVSCGRARLGHQIVIVDPQTQAPCDAGHVGEVWLRGESIAKGYWNREEETAQTFGATLEGSDETYLRTGDLGFMRGEELFVTGRVKDVMIIRGRNHYPQDIEQTVGAAHEALRPDAGAVFSMEVDGTEHVVIVHEVDRHYRKADFDEVIRAVRRSVALTHELEVNAVALIRHANLPRTTSGKVQRNLCRQQLVDDELKVLASWSRAKTIGAATRGRESEADRMVPSDRPMTPDELDRLSGRVETWLLTWLVERAAIPQDEVARDKPFAEYGLDSLTAVELTQELEDWLGVDVLPTVAWNYPTPATLSVYLAKQAGGVEDTDSGEIQADDEFERLLAEIETLSEEDAQRIIDSE